MKRLLLPLLAGTAAAQIPAFPGAEGFGAYATGGRGGDVYLVTNLNNNGAGSLRNGLNTAPAAGRTIVFAVSGYIPVVSDTNFNVPSRVTIAGQTAPGDGVGLRGGRMLVSGSNVVMRHFRIRHGRNGTGGDCLNIASTASNTMLDHISMMFSTDENFSFFNSSVNNFTLQYSNSSWGMERHNAGGLWDLQNGTCHHTLWAHHRTRNPKARPAMLEWINNVTFHWRTEGFIMGDSQTPANWKANVRGCYYISIPDPDTGYSVRNTGLVKATVASNGVPNFSLHLDDTLFDNNANGIADGTDRGYGIVSGAAFAPGDAVGANRYYRSDIPFPGATGAAEVKVDDAVTAYKKVLSSAAPLRLDANHGGPLRDELDTLLVDSVANQYSVLVQKDGKVAGEDPNRPNNGEQHLADAYGISNNGFGTLNGTTPPADADLDGMPDYWEITLNGANGVAYNVATADHNTAFTATQLPHTFFPAGTPVGYTRLEEYLHFRAVPHAVMPKNTPGAPSVQTIDLARYTSGFSRSPVFTLDSVTNGTAEQFLADGITPAAGGPVVKFTPVPDYSGRAGFHFTVTDAQGSRWTQPFAVLVSSVAAPRDLVWIGNGGTNVWDETSPHWRTTAGSATAFATGDAALLDDRGFASPAVSLSGALTPSSVVVTGSRNYALGGTGSIASTGPLTKAGEATLTLSRPVSFAGGSYLNGGETVIATGGNLDGGTIRFTGGSTLRSAYGDADTISLNPGIAVDAGATGYLTLSKRMNVKGALTGSGTLHLHSPSNLGTEGRAYLDGPTAAFAGTLHLTGGGSGRLALRSVGGSFNGFNNARVHLDGITLFTSNNSGGNTHAIGSLSGTANSAFAGNYNAAGATTLNIGGLALDSVFAGKIRDGLSPTHLTKSGGGTLTLTGANTYSGATTVNAGTLRVIGSLGGSAIGVAAGATLSGGFSTGGPVTLATGSTFVPGDVRITAGGLDVSGATLKYDLSSSPASGNDRVALTGGTLTLRSPAAAFDFTLTDGYLGEGTYVLVDGPTTATSAPGSPALTHNLPASTRQSFSLQRSGGGATANASVRLVVTGTAGNLTWTGSTSAWDIADSTPWSGGPGGDQRFFNLDRVRFDDTAENRSVTLTGNLQPSAIEVVNSGPAYTFAGSGAVGGKASLLKSGTGTLVIGNAAANTYSGGTTVSGGILELAATDAPLGTGAITMAGGTLRLPAAAIFLANPMVFSGSSAIASGNTGNSTLVNSTGATFSSEGEANVDLAGVNGILSINGRMDGFSGTLSFGPGSGMLRLNSNSSAASDVNSGSASAHFDLGSANARLTNRNGNLTLHLGALSGGSGTFLSGRQSGSGPTVTTCIIGEKNLSTVFDGTIGHGGDLGGMEIIKRGSGVWTLGGTSAFTGSIAVESGGITISGTTTVTGTAAVGSGASLTLTGETLGADAATVDGVLQGHGTLAGPLDLAGGLRGRGHLTGMPGTLAIRGDAIFRDSSVTRVRTGDVIAVTGDLDLGGRVEVQLPAGTVSGRHRLFTHGGPATMTAVLSGIPSGLAAHLSTSVPGEIALVLDDSDEDGLPDSWELARLGTLASSPDDDPDGDGTPNRVEHRLGLDPANTASAFRASLSRHTLVWPSAEGLTFRIERSVGLADDWERVGEVTGTGAFTDPSPPAGRAFYRVLLLPFQ